MTKRIEAVAGPYKGQNLDVEDDLAEEAIADGWAIDPFAPPLPEEDMEEVDQEEINAAAERAARKLRGEKVEDEPEAERKPKRGRPSKSRMMEAEAGGKPYRTRGT